MAYTLTGGKEYKAFIRFNGGQTSYFTSVEEARAHWNEYKSVLIQIGGVKTATLHEIKESEGIKL